MSLVSNNGRRPAPARRPAPGSDRVRASEAATPAPRAKTKPIPVIEKLHSLAKWLNGAVIGRQEFIDAMILAVASGQNALALGVPGTAKTMAVRMLAQAIDDGPHTVFDVLLTKFSKPDEVFGPVDIEALSNGEVRRRTAGFLPSARVGVLDEVFKGSSAILNSLLTLANERLFKNGTDWEKCPTRFLVGMSNELPDDPALLAAFFDRFPLKVMVGYLDEQDFTKLLTAPAPTACPVTITDEDFAAIDKARSAVKMTEQFAEILATLRAQLRSKQVEISDRRWVQAASIMRAHAILNGRTELTRKDLDVLVYVAWNQPKERDIIKALLPEFANPFAREVARVIEDAEAQRAAVLLAANVDKTDAARPSPDMIEATRAASEAFSNVRRSASKLDMIEDLCESDDDRESLAMARESIKAVEDVLKKIGLGADATNELKDIDLGVEAE